MNLRTEYHWIIREYAAEQLQNISIDEGVWAALGYQEKEHLINEIKTEGNFVGYEVIASLVKALQINLAIYWEDERYKGKDKWQCIYPGQKYSSKWQTYHLKLRQGKFHGGKNFEGHFTALIKKDVDQTAPQQITEIKKKKTHSTEQTKISELEIGISKLNCLLWNARSLNDYTKRLLLTQTLYENEIHLAFLQETMWSQTKKIYFKNYKIFRAHSCNGRKGVGILVSNKVKGKYTKLRKILMEDMLK
ncbi:MAG: hypothetical protein ACRC42_01645 [Mycoplasma sp.]